MNQSPDGIVDTEAEIDRLAARLKRHSGHRSPAVRQLLALGSLTVLTGTELTGAAAADRTR